MDAGPCIYASSEESWPAIAISSVHPAKMLRLTLPRETKRGARRSVYDSRNSSFSLVLVFLFNIEFPKGWHSVQWLTDRSGIKRSLLSSALSTLDFCWRRLLALQVASRTSWHSHGPLPIVDSRRYMLIIQSTPPRLMPRLVKSGGTRTT